MCGLTPANSYIKTRPHSDAANTVPKPPDGEGSSGFDDGVTERGKGGKPSQDC